MRPNWMQRLIWSISSNGWDSLIFATLLLIGFLWIVFANTGCATSQVAPRMGACLIDEGGNWFCKDADKATVPRAEKTRYVCMKLEEEWEPLMNFCKKKPGEK